MTKPPLSCSRLTTYLGHSRISKLALETATNKQLKIVHGMSSAASVPLPVGVTPVPGAPKNQHKTIACASVPETRPLCWCRWQAS